MPDSNQPAANQPASNQPQKNRSPLDSATIAQLDRDEQIVLAVKTEMAANPSFTSALAGHKLDSENIIEITPASVAALAQQIETARETGGEAVNATGDRVNASHDEDTLEKNLLDSIHNVQKRAKEKYEQKDRGHLHGYWVGKLIRTRPQIEEAGAALYKLVRTTDDDGATITPQDTLPGLKPEAIAAFKTNLGAYTGIQTTQTRAQGQASGKRIDLKEQVQQISRRRRKIQQAIDSEYPAGPQNAAYRKQFGLQGESAMK